MAEGTGHGAILRFLDPETPGDPSAGTRVAPGVQDSPLGKPGSAAPTAGQQYLIRDLQLHEESGDSADLSHLRTSVHRRYHKVDLYAVGTISFNVLFDTEIPETLIEPPNTPSGTSWSHPLPVVADKLAAGDWQDHTNVAAWPYFNGQGPMQILFPIRNPANDLPAILGPQTAWVTNRSFGNLETNQEHLCAVQMQWETNPPFNYERLAGP